MGACSSTDTKTLSVCSIMFTNPAGGVGIKQGWEYGTNVNRLSGRMMNILISDGAETFKPVTRTLKLKKDATIGVAAVLVTRKVDGATLTSPYLAVGHGIADWDEMMGVAQTQRPRRYLGYKVKKMVGVIIHGEKGQIYSEPGI